MSIDVGGYLRFASLFVVPTGAIVSETFDGEETPWARGRSSAPWVQRRRKWYVSSPIATPVPLLWPTKDSRHQARKGQSGITLTFEGRAEVNSGFTPSHFRRTVDARNLQ
jgi:hypothetical protein